MRPKFFEQQLKFLQDAGYYSVSLNDWRKSKEARPLPGRAVLITFSDGYQYLLTYAWPSLERFGFSTTVFLVAGAIGMINHWDHPHGEEVPLLTWDQIKHLQAEGFKSDHTRSFIPHGSVKCRNCS